MKNPTVQKTIRVATIAGSSILVIRSAMQLFGVKSVREAIMPTVSILVGVAAFNYAISSKPAEVKA
jgi:hypothetical protein